MRWEIVIGAVALDFLLGDPRRLPHPVRWMGRLIMAAEGLFYPRHRSPRKEFLAGCLVCVAVIAVCAGCGYLALAACQSISPVALAAAGTIIGFYCLSARSLVREAGIVRTHLAGQNPAEARRALSMIVGRDTDNLDEAGMVRAAVETVAENITDGIVSPLFYFALGGPVAALAFKAVSTMDSMIGHKNQRYRHFGTCAARFDDVLNFIPARITAFFLIPLAALILRLDWKKSLRIAARDRLLHESPNSAHGEAAMAGALNIQLGGGAFYDKEFSPRPFLGDNLGKIDPDDIARANKIAVAVACITAIMASAAVYFAETGFPCK